MLIKLGKHRTIALPKELQTSLGDDAVLDLTVREDGVLELRVVGEADPEQAWFWTDEWQRGERHAAADVEAGRVVDFDDIESLVTHLQAIPSKPVPPDRG